MNILINGHVCIDHNRTEHASFTAAGSPAMFMAKIFRQIPGCLATIVAPYGDDFVPYAHGISLVPHAPLPISTMVYENTVIAGIRTQRCLHADTAVPVPVSSAVADAVRLADIICIAPLSPDFPASYLTEFLSHKNPESVVVLLPQGYFRAIAPDGEVRIREFTEAPGILPLVDAVIVSDQDHGAMADVSAAWADTYGKTVVMTRAQDGADIFTRGTRSNVPTTPVPPEDIVSSIGAGDIFSAGFMYTFRTTRDPVASAQFGNILARQCLLVTPDHIQIQLP